MTTRPSRAAGHAAALLVLLAVSACGIAAERSPTRLPDAGLPSTSGSTTTSVQPPVDSLDIYLVRDGRLVDRTRTAKHQSVEDAVTTLLDGPSSGDDAAGLRSAIAEGTRLLGASTHEGVAAINLSQEFAGVSGDEQVLAVAQLVYTVTSVPGISSVNVAVEGHDIEVPGGDGSLLNRPATRSDYAALVA
ncbi:MAG TPA: GerMN domain-containing protein [Acidimicrobiales bacterium]|nr:GerMN domain-containing protein [Acidimicrobiales bacterium]